MPASRSRPAASSIRERASWASTSRRGSTSSSRPRSRNAGPSNAAATTDGSTENAGASPDGCLAFLRFGAHLLRLAILPLRGGHRLPLHVGNAIGAAAAERLEVADHPTRARLLVLAVH